MFCRMMRFDRQVCYFCLFQLLHIRVTNDLTCHQVDKNEQFFTTTIAIHVTVLGNLSVDWHKTFQISLWQGEIQSCQEMDISVHRCRSFLFMRTGLTLHWHLDNELEQLVCIKFNWWNMFTILTSIICFY